MLDGWVELDCGGIDGMVYRCLLGIALPFFTRIHMILGFPEQ